MVEMKDSVYWSKKKSEKNSKLELQITMGFFKYTVNKKAYRGKLHW